MRDSRARAADALCLIRAAVGVVIAAAAVFLLTGGGSGPVDVCNTYQDCSRTLLGVAVAEC